ncbi:MAG TPA: RteC domain-containing protein, partial [Flavobacterium sp.]
NDRLREYIESQIEKTGITATPNLPYHKSLKWTGSKVGIVELVYALHTQEVFNNGACDLKDIMAFFSKSFDIDLAQFHRTFFEISARKSERTKFLSSLKDSLVKRMENAEQN